MEKRTIYGGQAVIEGVMIRGQSHYSLAVRKPNGEITTESSKLSTLYTGSLRKLPLIRGVVVLLETMVIGIKALTRSANIALEEEEEEFQTDGEDREEDDEEPVLDSDESSDESDEDDEESP